MRRLWPAAFLLLLASRSPQDLIQTTQSALERNELGSGAREVDGFVVAVGTAPIASFGNRARAGQHAEEKAELAAFGELRMWALSHQQDRLASLTAQLKGVVSSEALKAYLGSIDDSQVEVRDVLQKASFQRETLAYAILVVDPASIGAPAIDPSLFQRRFEEFLQTDPGGGEAAYEYYGVRSSQAEQLLWRQLEAEGYSVEALKNPYASVDFGGKGQSPEAMAKAKEGLALLAKSQPEQARALFLQALSLEPLLAPANLGLAQVYIGRKMPRLALRFVELAFCGEADRQRLYQVWAQALEAAGRKPEAELATAQARQTAPGAPVMAEMLSDYYALMEAKLFRVAFLVRSDAHIPVVQLSERWPRRTEEAARLFAQGQAAFQQTTDTTAALAYFLKALEADPFHVDALNYTAACLRTRKNSAGSRLFAALATGLDSRHGPATVNLALALEALGAKQLARSEFETARDLNPQDSWSQRKIAEGLARLRGGN